MASEVAEVIGLLIVERIAVSVIGEAVNWLADDGVMQSDYEALAGHGDFGNDIGRFIA